MQIVHNPLSEGGDPGEECGGPDAAPGGAARHHAHHQVRGQGGVPRQQPAPAVTLGVTH